jgi:hypothetical protein
MIESLGLYCNNFNLLELIWYEFRNQEAFCWNSPSMQLSGLCGLCSWPCLWSGPRLLINGPWKEGVEYWALQLCFAWGGNKQKYLPWSASELGLPWEGCQSVVGEGSVWHLCCLWALLFTGRQRGQDSPDLCNKKLRSSTKAPTRVDWKQGHGSPVKISFPYFHSALGQVQQHWESWGRFHVQSLPLWHRSLMSLFTTTPPSISEHLSSALAWSTLYLCPNLGKESTGPGGGSWGRGLFVDPLNFRVRALFAKWPACW